MSEANSQNEVLDFNPSPEFLARKKRLDDALNLRKPDRVPVFPLVVHYYPTKIKGISNKEAMYPLFRKVFTKNPINRGFASKLIIV